MAILDLQSLGTPEAVHTDVISLLSVNNCHHISTISITACG